MKRSQWIVAILAVFGAWVIISIVSSLVTRPLSTSCMVMLRHDFEAPNKESIIQNKVVNCPDGKSTSSLALLSSKEGAKHTIFFETPSRFVDAKGVNYNPVTFGIRWNDNTNVDIFYPPGLNIYNNVTGDPSLNEQEVRKDVFYGVSG